MSIFNDKHLGRVTKDVLDLMNRIQDLLDGVQDATEEVGMSLMTLDENLEKAAAGLDAASTAGQKVSEAGKRTLKKIPAKGPASLAKRGLITLMDAAVVLAKRLKSLSHSLRRKKGHNKNSKLEKSQELLEKTGGDAAKFREKLGKFSEFVDVFSRLFVLLEFQQELIERKYEEYVNKQSVQGGEPPKGLKEQIIEEVIQPIDDLVKEANDALDKAGKIKEDTVKKINDLTGLDTARKKIEDLEKSFADLLDDIETPRKKIEELEALLDGGLEDFKKWVKENWIEFLKLCPEEWRPLIGDSVETFLRGLDTGLEWFDLLVEVTVGKLGDQLIELSRGQMNEIKAKAKKPLDEAMREMENAIQEIMDLVENFTSTLDDLEKTLSELMEKLVGKLNDAGKPIAHTKHAWEYTKTVLDPETGLEKKIKAEITREDLLKMKESALKVLGRLSKPGPKNLKADSKSARAKAMEVIRFAGEAPVGSLFAPATAADLKSAAGSMLVACALPSTRELKGDAESELVGSLFLHAVEKTDVAIESISDLIQHQPKVPEGYFEDLEELLAYMETHFSSGEYIGLLDVSE